jgi:Na+/H+-translocating membrane pyrophosphatase
MIGVGSLVSCVASALVLLQRKYTPENDPAVDGVEPVAKPGIKAFTAKQVRLQLLIVNSYTAGVLFAISLICLPDTTFNIGDDVLSPFYFENATVGTAIWCLEIGLLTQTVKLVLAEYFTSHRFQPIRSVAGDTRQGKVYF